MGDITRAAPGKLGMSGNTEADHFSHSSHSVRKIENGFITRHTESDQDGYRETEKFSPDHPQISPHASEPQSIVQSRGLKGAKACLERSNKY
jgi:hypothetical protein